MGSILIKLFVLQCLSILTAAAAAAPPHTFDFFYFVQELSATFCTSGHCCMSTTEIKPSDNFTIHGLWPNYKTGGWPQFCDVDGQSSELNKTEISELVDRMQEVWPTLACPTADGIKLWSHEWSKHERARPLVNTLISILPSTFIRKPTCSNFQALSNAGITLGNQLYSLSSIKQAIEESTWFEPCVECNVDHHDHMHELFQVYLCGDKSGQELIKCPVLPHGRGCGSTVELPSFTSQRKYSLESNAEI